MESVRWLVCSPMVIAVLAGTLAPGRLAGAPGAEAAWEPPPCPTARAAPPGPGAWYRLDGVLDRTGTLVARRLAIGVAGDVGKMLQLAPESFTSGPVDGLVLVGEDDGSASRLRLLDPERGCAMDVAGSAEVIRSAVLVPGGHAVYEHRVDRSTRVDLGVWRREPSGPAARVLDGLAPDARLGPTFVTDLVLGADGRLAVSSCAPAGCRVRIVDPATGESTTVTGTGPALGFAGDALVARSACRGYPCPVERVDPATGARRSLADDAMAAALVEGRLVLEAAHGGLAVVDVATGRRRDLAAAGGVPLRSGSTASAGAEGPPGTVALAPGGRPRGRTLHHLDARTGAVHALGEDAR